MKAIKTYKKFGVGEEENRDGDVLVATVSTNCDCSDGTLKAGIGLRQAVAENGKDLVLDADWTEVSVLYSFYALLSTSNIEYLGVIKGEDELYYYNYKANNGEGGWTFIAKIGGGRTHAFNTQDENGSHRTHWLSESGLDYFWTCYTVSSISVARPIGCCFEGRIFVVIDESKIQYTTTYGMFIIKGDRLTEDGYVILPSHSGAICGITPFQNKLYVFCDYGIFEMQAKGNARDFTLTALEYNGGKIFGDSVGVCQTQEGGIFFLTENGVCVFDGKTTRKVCDNLAIDPLVNGQYCTHAEYGGKYHVCFWDKRHVKRSVVIDCITGKGYYAFVPMALNTLHKKGYCAIDGRIFTIEEGGGLPKDAKRLFWAKTDFGQKKRKSLHTLSMTAEGTITIRVSDEKRLGTREIVKSFDGGRETFFIRLRADTFDIQFELGDNAYVKDVSAEYETLD